ncbi:MAG: PhoH family protein [Aquificota bacterium]|nr:PhoH family protein [Aquificota bacterium]
MFLTHAELQFKVVVTENITQMGLPKREHSNLVEALRVLEGRSGIGFVWFSQEDVVRHPIVARIISAYEGYERGRDSSEEQEAEEELAQE